VTEFLPVSSSAHLNLLPWLLRWPDPGLSFDVALHAGTLLAVAGYFWKDWAVLFAGARADLGSPQARLLGVIAAATVPGALAGALLQRYAEGALRAPVLTGAMLILFGIFLGLAERRGAKSDPLDSVGLKRALWIGVSQGLAVIPGVSRSGVTITAGLLQGLEPEAATRFSFLLSTPIILGAALHEARKIHEQFFTLPTLVAVAVSAATGLLAIRLMLACLRRAGFAPYVWYRLALGGGILLLSAVR
jgi:undecaprenyl-diphosphatase